MRSGATLDSRFDKETETQALARILTADRVMRWVAAQLRVVTFVTVATNQKPERPDMIFGAAF